MSSSKGPSSIRNMAYNGKRSLLPPKSPFPSISPSYVDHIPSFTIPPKPNSMPKDGSRHHRTFSESVLIEEQPSWLDELLNEPETPVCRGHRRSSSDSFTYTDAINLANVDYIAQDEFKYKNMIPISIWGSQEFENHKDASRAAYYTDPKSWAKQKNWVRDSSVNTMAHSTGRLSSRDSLVRQASESASASPEVGIIPSTENERQQSAESGPPDPKTCSERKNSSANPSASETDAKRAKQQFAQRSRVRKLQYIAELERNVQALQEQGSEVSAEVEYLNQQILILSMENNALKQRLESLAQEQIIKYFEHEVLEREIGRLRALYQQQQPQQSSLHSTNSKDLDQQFSNLSLRSKEARASHNHVSNLLNI